jgi:predicted negative regulator of RcsB-dependent stress response
MLEKLHQIKQFVKSNESELILATGVILVSLISFAAGRLTEAPSEKQRISIENFASVQSSFQNITSTSSLQDTGAKANAAGKFVASKNSNKYHLPACTGAKRIAEHNKIWFNSKEEAESLGYQPASNCPGL